MYGAEEKTPFESRIESPVPAAAAAKGNGKGKCTDNIGDRIALVSKCQNFLESKVWFRAEHGEKSKRPKADAQESAFISRSHKVPGKVSAGLVTRASICLQATGKGDRMPQQAAAILGLAEKSVEQHFKKFRISKADHEDPFLGVMQPYVKHERDPKRRLPTGWKILEKHVEAKQFVDW